MRSFLQPRVAALLALSLGAILHAQQYTGEGPRPVNPPSVYQHLVPAKLGYLLVDDLSITPFTSPSDIYVVAAGRQTRTGQTRMAAFTYDSTTGSVTRLTDYDALTQDGDRQPSVSRDRTLTTWWRGDNKIYQSTRSAPSSPWGPAVPITGLPANSYAPALSRIDLPGMKPTEIVLSINTAALNAEIGINKLDRGGASAIRAMVIRPRLKSQNDWIRFAAPVEDSAGNLTALFLGYQQGFPNIGGGLQFVTGLEPTSPVHDSWGEPGIAVISGTWGLGGGSGIVMGLKNAASAGPLADNPIRLDAVLTTDASVPASGGTLNLNVLVPPDAVSSLGTVMIGLPGGSGIQIPGFSGLFGLDPNTFVPLPAKTLSSQFESWTLQTPWVSPAEVWSQSVLMYRNQIGLSNTARVSVK